MGHTLHTDPKEKKKNSFLYAYLNFSLCLFFVKINFLNIRKSSFE